MSALHLPVASRLSVCLLDLPGTIVRQCLGVDVQAGSPATVDESVRAYVSLDGPVALVDDALRMLFGRGKQAGAA